ncbi:DNA repair protein SMC6 [Rhodotorula paludigena]|uniref:DNA repair protein SMC6 n=1 Tax=Rhodotorula paludigena TaxID=86838 RepID=UPI003171AA0C
MAKHALDEHAGDAGSSASSHKRQRTSPLPRSTPPRDRNGDSDDDADYDAAGDGEGDQEDSSMDEDEPEQQPRAFATQKKGPTKVAQAGVIQRVELVSFMCHAHTTVDFGPQVNFLVGVNGSGKSAILTGITMALGGSAKNTNRGMKGGDLIMENKPSARCSVTLANKGEEAFQRDVYGDSITIERTINKTGGGYKIKNHEGKTVETKKATLDAILDAFNVQVDNPLTVLTQDQSRQFLASASEKDKYTFFLRGTQLAQLTEEYEQIRANTEVMDESLQRKKEVLPDLKDAYRKAKERAKDARAAMEQAANLQNLKDQLAWSFVDEIEAKIVYGERKINEELDKVATLDAQIAKLEEKVAVHDTQISDLREAEKEAQETLASKQPRLEELKELIKAERSRASAFKDFERKMNNETIRLKQTIAEFEAQIAAEEAKLARDIEAERRPLRERIAQSDAEVEQLAVQMQENRHATEDLAEKFERSVSEYEDVKSQLRNADGQASDIRGRIEYARRAQGDNLLSFGQKTPDIVRMIRQERGWREAPIGPIGLHVKLDKQQYAGVLESFFGATLNAFIVTSREDQQRMSRIFSHLRVDHQTPIILNQPDANFDHRTGEPDPSILTVLRACTINNVTVVQALCTALHIERAALVPTRPDGDTLMRTNPRNVEAAYSVEGFMMRNNQGKASFTSMAPWRGQARLHRDVAAVLKRFDEELGVVMRDIAALQQRKDQVGQQCRSFEQDKKLAEQRVKEAQRRTLNLNRIIAECTAKLQEEEPNNIAALTENKRETEEELQNVTNQYTAGLAAYQRDGQDSNAEALVTEKRELEATIKKREALVRQCTTMMEKEFSSINDHKSHIQQHKKAQSGMTQRIDQWRGEVEEATTLRDNRIEQATAICERPQVTKHKEPRKLQKEIETLQRALKDRERRQGATLDQILEELEVRKKAAAEAVKATNELSGLIEVLGNAYETRIGRWTDFRSHIAARARQQFLKHLANRGFTGKLRFNHHSCKLEISIRTEETGKDGKKARTKDTKSLSGGEKSFSTICLLLTMWECVGCPLRCLDEFDVFMDAVNRRIAMRMMIDTAKQADATQFILITPQEMSSISWGSEVKVTKLEDPKRAAGALAHGR